MKRLSSTAFIFCISFSALAADTTTVSLMKKVIALEIPSSYPYFYLLNKGTTSVITRNDISSLHWDDTQLKATLVPEFLAAAQKDTVAIKWSDYHLPRAKCVSKRHIPKKGSMAKVMASLPPVDPNTGAILASMGSKVDLKALAEITFVSFSKPVFSADGQYAFITANRDMSGHNYLLKKNNGTWELISQNGWME